AGSFALARKHSRRIPLERLPSTGVVPSRLELTGSCARKCPEHFDDALSPAEFHASLEGVAGTVVGQSSRPVSIAARTLRQNSSSCFWRRAIASTLPSSMTRFRFDMMPPQRYACRLTLSLVGSSPALAEESVRDFEVLVSPVPKPHQAMWAFSGLAHGARALPLPSE